MRGLAEKIGFVGRDGVDEMHEFTLEAVILEEVIAIIIERCKAQNGQAGAQPDREHGAFGRRHLDAAVLMDQLGQALEIARAEALGGIGQQR